jgi:hypothetical protein
VKFLIDQALSPAVATELNRAGHDAVYVRELRMQAASDEEIFDHAARDDRVVVSGFARKWVVRRTSGPREVLAPEGSRQAVERRQRVTLARGGAGRAGHSAM